MGLLILTLVSLVTPAWINFATRQAESSGEVNKLNTLIESDLVHVRTANDRLVCNDGTCSIASNNPGQSDYFPVIADPTNVTGTEQANIDFFLNLCSYRRDNAFDVNAGFANQLATRLTSPDGRLRRNISPENGGHRYTVTYTRPEGDPTILRQVTLVPATVAWCPCVPSGTSAADLCP